MSNTDTDALAKKADDELYLIEVVLRGYPTSMAQADALRAANWLRAKAIPTQVDTIERLTRERDEAVARESALHDAVCQAVSIMNMAIEIARSETGRKAKDILRQALVDYADAAIRQEPKA